MSASTAAAIREPAHVGVRVIGDGAGTAFDPDVVRVFNRLVMPYPVGTEVPLPGEDIGVVAEVDPARPYEPLVRTATGDVRLDLAPAPA